ncbi:GNAT family N-acetyltransferase [Novacetimonas hansenii]|uniref:hypothetical protein n=1 Tax=Novacetimonas hansenii TaxID=436 RepID=UPI00094F8264|nr:hypothetical protein [Novacetimonas hansenii]
MSCVLVSGDATGQVFGSVRVSHDGNRVWRSSVAAAQEGGEGIGHAVGEAGAHWLRAPCARGADHASPPNHGAPFYAHIGHEGMSRVPMGKWRLPPR